MGVYGSHTQVKCLLKALIFGKCKEKHNNVFPDGISALSVTELNSDGLKVTKSPNIGSLWTF